MGQNTVTGTYTLEKLPGERIVVGIMGRQFTLSQDAADYLAKLKTILESSNEKCIYINDLREISINFGDMVTAMASTTRGDQAVLKHPNIQSVVLVANNPIIRLGTNALQQFQYGGIRSIASATLEEALEIARTELKSAK